MRRLIHPVTVFFIVLFVILLFVGRTRLFRDPGTFWHVVVGEQILSTGTFPRTDSFSFTHHGQPWIAYHWLSECAMAGLHRLGGLDALLVATAAGLALLYAWIGLRWMNAGFHWSLAYVGICLAIAVSVHNWHARPHVFTMALLGITYAILIDVEAGRRTWKALLWLPPLFLLWSNLHGGALGGLGAFGVVVLGWTALWLTRQSVPVASGRLIGVAWLALLLSLATTVITPYGGETPAYWVRIISLDLPTIIQEHAPIDPREYVGIAIIGLGVLYLVALLGIIPNQPRITWLVPLAWFALACMRNRQGPLFGIVAALALADLLPATVYVRRLAARRSDLFAPPGPERPQAGWPALLPPILIALIALLYVSSPLEREPFVRLDPARWPIELLPELKEVEKTPDAKIFNQLDHGGFLIYHVPGLPVFVDDRCELYGNNFLEIYAQAERERPDTLGRWAFQYRFTHALVATDSPFDQFLAKQGAFVEVVKRTPAFTLYRRR